MRRRLLPHVCMLVTLLAWSSSDAAAKPATSWAQAELRAVVAAGLMAKETAARPNDALTRGELETISAGLLQLPAVPPAAASATVTMSALDAKLVTTLGLSDTAKLFVQNAKASGLAPPTRFGTEAVARLLGLRTNHPASLDNSSSPRPSRRTTPRPPTPPPASCASASGTCRRRRGSRRRSSCRR